MNTTRCCFGSLFIFLFLFFGCFEQFGVSQNEKAAPEIPELIIFKGPNSQNSPEELLNSIKAFNAHMSTGYTYLSLATITNPHMDGDRAVWNVRAGGFSGVIEADKQSDNSVDWTVTISGSDGARTYDNWVVLRGNAATDGSNGEWHVFEENSTVEIGVWSYSVEKAGRRSGVFTMRDGQIRYEIVNNPDSSGRFIKKEMGQKVYEAIWDSSGAGSWTSWDGSGAVTNTGTWS